jgi:hypothetical protein
MKKAIALVAFALALEGAFILTVATDAGASAAARSQARAEAMAQRAARSPLRG